MASLRSVLFGLLAWLASAVPAAAISIDTIFIDKPVPAMTGGGDPEAVFDAAARYWEAAILDDQQITIGWTWSGIGSGLGIALPLDSSPRPGGGLINFSIAETWFVDPTPYEDEEWAGLRVATLPNGINSGRTRTDPIGAAAQEFDFFSVAVHEIGHILGLVFLTDSWAAETPDGDIDLTSPRPFPGESLPTTEEGGGHLDLPDALMWPFIDQGERQLLSDADVLAVAELAGYTQLVFDPVRSVPEASVGWLLATSALLLAAAGRERLG